MVPLLLLPLLWRGEWGEEEARAQVGEGPELQLSLCVPTGSFQDDSGFKLRVQKSVTVQEGLCVPVLCSFSYSWSAWHPPAKLYMYWYDTHRNNLVATNNPNRAVSVETEGRFRLLGDSMTNDCSLGIRDARKSDTGNYYFRVERGYVNHNYMDKILGLQVTGTAGAQERTWDVGLRVSTGMGHWNSYCPGLRAGMVGRDVGLG